MSVADVERESRRVVTPERTVDLPATIREKLLTVSRRAGRAESLHRLASAASVALLAALGLIIADVLLGLRWMPVRWAIWAGGWVIALGAIRFSWGKPRQPSEQLLDAAWKIDSSHPAMEERLTSTVQFLSDDSRQIASPQLIDALVSETSESVGKIDPEAISTRSPKLPAATAAVLATALVCSAAIWPETVLTSLDNLATPWSPYVVRTLSADITPGDVTIAEGESVHIQVVAAGALDQPTLEIIRDDVVESRSMVSASPKESTLTLKDVLHDAVYRIRSGGLRSVPHTITVHPQPHLTAISAHLIFPGYTHLEPLTIENVTKPIPVPAGTEVTLTAASNGVAVDGVIRWNSKPEELLAQELTDNGSNESVQFEWTFRIEPETDLVGTLELRSEHGVRSAPHPIQLRALKDSPPKIEITHPRLRHVTMRRDGDLPIRYRVIDDFGVSNTELMLKLGQQEPVAVPCPPPEEQPGDELAWTGATSLELSDVPVDCQEVSLWLRVADNRPDEFGGAQMIESEKIQITLDDQAESLGGQQILAERQMIEPSLEQAIEQMQEALAAAEALQNEHSQSPDPDQRIREAQALAANDLGPDPTRPPSRTDRIETLRRQASEAKQTLVRLGTELQDESDLFQPRAAEIERVADQEVTEALELANQIPLADDQLQQDELARGSGQRLKSAIDQLDRLKSDIEQQAEQMNEAAQLDQLAAEQQRLAREAAEGQRDDVPNKQWQDRQEEVADDLQNLVEANEEARRQQLLQRAQDAERLAQQVQELAQQQRQLGEIMEEAQPDNRQADELHQRLQDLIAARKGEVDRQSHESGESQDGPAEAINTEVEPKQRMDDPAQAAGEGASDQVASKIQERIAERVEQIQQQADRFARQNITDQAAKEQINQAVEQLQQAKDKADKAENALGKNAEGKEQNRARVNDGEHQQDQQDVARTLEQAAESLNQACKSCRECANGNKRGSSSASKSGDSRSGSSPENGSPEGDARVGDSPKTRAATTDSSPVAKPLANAVDDAKQAAESRSNQKAAQNAESVAEQLNQLADEAAQASGYSLRQPKDPPNQLGKQQGTGHKAGNQVGGGHAGRPSGDPEGVGQAAGDTAVNGQRLRGASDSNWTRARRKLNGGVLDDREGKVPEQYRGVVERYFEELSRQQSSRGE